MRTTDGQAPEARRHRARTKSILNAAASQFAKNGYERTSLSDVADRVDLTPKALYHYYSSKRDLLEAVLLEEFAYFDRETLAAARHQWEGLPLADALTESSIAAMRELFVHGNLLLVSFTEGTRHSDAIRKRHHDFRQNWTEHVRAIVDADAGVPMRRRAIFAEHLVSILLGTVIQAIVWPRPEVFVGSEPSWSYVRSIVVGLLEGVHHTQPSVTRGQPRKPPRSRAASAGAGK